MGTGRHRIRSPITGFHRDAEGHWVAELACGHAQHTRHDPPLSARPWVLTEEGRRSRLGVELECARCARGEPAVIYHLTPLSELRAGIVARSGGGTGAGSETTDPRRVPTDPRDERTYAPARLPVDGFVHCAGARETTLAVARDVFARRAAAAPDDPIVCLAIQVGLLRSPVRFEAPAPLAEAEGTTHLATAERFPHVYGPIDLPAVVGAGVLRHRAAEPDASGELAAADSGAAGIAFGWPDRFVPLDTLLAEQP